MRGDLKKRKLDHFWCKKIDEGLFYSLSLKVWRV
jgi:hypothetical protein